MPRVFPKFPPVAVPVLAPTPPPRLPKSPPPPAVVACVVGPDPEEVVDVPRPKPLNDRLGAELAAAGAAPKRGAEVVEVEVVFVFKLPKREGLLLEPAFAFVVSRLSEKRLFCDPADLLPNILQTVQICLTSRKDHTETNLLDCTCCNPDAKVDRVLTI